MRKLILLLLSVVGVGILAQPAAALGTVVFADNFDDGVLGSQWVFTELTCGSATETGGALVMNKTSSCAGGILLASDPGLQTIRGDFEAVVDFDLPGYNVSNAFRVAALSIRTVDLLHGAVIERYNRGVGDNAPNLFNYKAWIDVSLNTSPAVAWAATTHTSGKFRIARSGGLISMSYWSGASWVVMKTGAFPLGDVQLLLLTSSGTVVNAGWTARWDNLVVTASETVPVPEVCLVDDFGDGILDDSLIPATGCPAGAIVESGGKLRLDGGGCAGASTVRLDKTHRRLCGDFDVAVDVRKLIMGTPTSGGWLYAGLSIGDTSMTTTLLTRAGIEFHNRFANGDCAFTSSLKAWNGPPINCNSTVRNTSATAVRFRIQRLGARLRMFVHGGGGWLQMRDIPFTTQPMLLELFAGSGTAGNPISVEFDNLEARCSTEDEGAPVVTIPPDAQYVCPADVPPISLDGVTATGPAVNGPVSVAYDELSNEGAGSAASPLILQRRFSATNLCHHGTTAIQTITVIDDVMPTLDVPGNVTPAAGPGIGPCPAIISSEAIGQATGGDNCGSPTIALSGVPEGNLFPEGETVLTWTATDAAGNATTATQTVNIACPRGRVAGEVVRACNGTTEPVEGIAVELLHAGDVIATTATGPTGEFAFDEVRLASYTVRVGVLAGYAVDIDTRLISLETGAVTLALEPFTFTCLLSDLTGTVTATCNAATTPAAGATVDLYREDEMGQQVLVATTSTDLAGAYQFSDLALGTYEISIVTPLGYVATPAAQEVVLATPDGLVAAQAIELGCQPIAAEPRSMGYWKHQVNVYLTGKGHAQESLVDLLSYIDLIVERFNENPLHPVALYDAGASGTGDRLRELQRLLTVNRGGTGNDRARQQLLALLLNVVSLKIAQSEVISADGATVSQAITHCYDLVADGNAANDEAAKDIAETIVTGGQVVAGAIPLTTATIAYRDRGTIAPASPALEFAFRGAWPNPARGTVRLAFTLDSNEPVRVEVFDVVGRRVLDRTWRDLGVGVQAVALPGGEALRAGVYTVRLTHGERTQSARFVRVE